MTAVLVTQMLFEAIETTNRTLSAGGQPVQDLMGVDATVMADPKWCGIDK
jgi:hypothetical protein